MVSGKVHYGWVIVAAGGLMGCVAMGAVFALPVLLLPIARDTGWSSTGVSAAMTIGFLAMAFSSMAWGWASDRFGPRPVLVAGSVLIAVSLYAASRTTSLLAFQVVFGVFTGVGVSALFPPLMASVTGWFDRHRSLAVSLVSAGIGMAPLTMSPLVALMVSTYDWRTTLAAVAGIAAVVTIPMAFLVRRPPPQALAAHGADAPSETTSVTEVVRSPQFVVLLLTNFFCCATHSGPIFHTVSYAITCGIPMMAAVTIYSVEGLAGMGGRVAFGLLGDRFGAKHTLVFGLLAQAFGALAYVFASNLISFYSVAAMFGFIYAGIMPLYAVLARENFPYRSMGLVIGGSGMAGGFGMAAGPLAGGMIYDSFDSYRWLYVGSFAIGLCAFLVAALFRPLPRPAPSAATA
jgi:MFS family permease